MAKELIWHNNDTIFKWSYAFDLQKVANVFNYASKYKNQLLGQMNFLRRTFQQFHNI